MLKDGRQETEIGIRKSELRIKAFVQLPITDIRPPFPASMWAVVAEAYT
jgi:hypothetical protein